MREDGVEVAVKVAADRPNAVDAIKTEIAMVQALGQAGVQGVVACLEVVKVDGRIGMVMPRYPGHLGTWLQRVMHEPTPGTLDEVLRTMAVLSRILSNVHSVDFGGTTLVHRDVKPENIFIDETGGLVLGDFGGAMAIDGLRRVELAMFGTPMWAPLDQILPGRTIPDPTWDTYAVCVLLYAGITGARPAYQADPRTLLTQRGGKLWELAKRAIEATGPRQTQLRTAFSQERMGASDDDLLDCTGKSALNDADREVLERRLDTLLELDGASWHARHSVKRNLWDVLTRGLSPVSHPSPPNRYRDAAELAEALEDLRETLVVGEALARSQEVDAPAATTWEDLQPPVSPEPVEHRPRGTGLVVVPIVLVALLLGAAATAVYFTWDRLVVFLPGPSVVDIAGGRVVVDGAEVVVAPFRLDRDEVTVGRYRSCALAGECSSARMSDDRDRPAVGLGLADAQRVCSYEGGRVPTEAEWHAAVGPEPWPWGPSLPGCTYAVAKGCAQDVQPVGSRPLGASADGVRDLAGNAWEWVVGADGRGVLVGGSVTSPGNALGKEARLEPAEGMRPPTAGVRCAYDPPG